MTLSEDARDRLADVVELQPTKNSELQDRWNLESGSEVHQFLENELGEYYFRDDNSLIRATPEAADLVDVEPGVVSEEGEGPPSRIRVPELQAQIVEVLAGPEERSQSVVAVLHALRDSFDVDPDVDEVRSGLQSLRRKDVVEVEYRTVPTFRLAVERDDLEVDISR
ncbi:DUF5797 family protein [Natronosalvus halobius]|uniref:DUF5797 family protein n=1 Tax=Natronosalvus halobius TaxID=2953746 RepID=UPI00209CFD50|nr:DUF5797 family protein [Natronosalvus halobius]USZ73026.1 DUF5797 family protein [Natronosalvus halobius]